MMRVLILLLVAGTAGAGESPDLALILDREGPETRFGLDGSPPDPEPQGLGHSVPGASAGRPISPFLAGLMSATIPGSGQLMQGQSRGWLYLGAEVVIWFSYFALRSAGNQSEEDYREFADEHWDFVVYAGDGENPPANDCGEGLGPVNFEEERDQLVELIREGQRDAYYEEIGRRDVYACGWDTQDHRANFLSMRDHANSLFGASNTVGGIAVLNHLVSAIDAARTAARNRASNQSLGWRVSPVSDGVTVHMELTRRF